MLLHTKRQVFKILVFCNTRCFIVFVTAVCVLFIRVRKVFRKARKRKGLITDVKSASKEAISSTTDQNPFSIYWLSIKL